jgi:hypothetical protein
MRAGLRWTRQRRAREAKGRAGSPCEPVATCGRAALKSGEASWRSRMSCVRQNRVVLAVVATVKPFAEMCASPTGWTASSIRGAREARRKVRLPGERGISRPTTAQGRPSVRLHLYAAVRFFCATSFAQRTAGASRHPVFPAPSWTRGRSDQAKLGRNAPREREGVSATTHTLSSSGLTGRSSIPEAVMIEPRGCGVLDSPPSRGRQGSLENDANAACSVLASAYLSPSPPRNGEAIVAGGGRFFSGPRRATARLAAWPFILRGSHGSAVALPNSHLRMTELGCYHR